MARSATLDELAQTIESRRAVLFTGAGFSSDARDACGEPLPDGDQMRRELWSMCFGDCEPDASTLCDLYDVAMVRDPDRLHAYVARRLTIGDSELPPHLARWLAAPWKRIYTLNVDDLEVALSRQYSLPRPLEVVHLNGVASAGARALTFSTLQYAARLCGTDPVYAELVRDLESSPFVFAGTTLDEIVLWQHVELRRRDRAAANRERPRSYLVTTSLSRARQELLATLGITWVRGTVEQVAERLPPPPPRRVVRSADGSA
jgi:hypothetical protein